MANYQFHCPDCFSVFGMAYDPEYVPQHCKCPHCGCHEAQLLSSVSIAQKED